MLPKRLAQVKAQLVAKTYEKRSAVEDELLAELEALDLSFRTSLDTQKVAKSLTFEDSRMTTAPSGRCPCCGN